MLYPTDFILAFLSLKMCEIIRDDIAKTNIKGTRPKDEGEPPIHLQGIPLFQNCFGPFLKTGILCHIDRLSYIILAQIYSFAIDPAETSTYSCDIYRINYSLKWDCVISVKILFISLL